MSNTVQKIEQKPETAVAITPMQMLQIAVEQGADLDKLSKLMDLQERWEKNEARKAYVAALTAFKEHPPTVMKNKRASFGRSDSKTEYEYATLAQVVDVIAPALSKHGLSHRWATEQSKEGGIAVTCWLTHQMGHSESVTLTANADTSGSKNSIQAIGSTVTYLQRYTLLAITGLAAVDQDDDGRGLTQTITAEQKMALVDLMREGGEAIDTAKFLGWLGVETLDQLPAKRFDEAKGALERKIAATRKNAGGQTAKPQDSAPPKKSLLE